MTDKISKGRALLMIHLIVAGTMYLQGCSVNQQAAYHIARIEGERIEINSNYDSKPDSAALAVFTRYQDELQQLTSPIIGRSAESMTAKYPNSKLGNLIAEVIKLSAQEKSGSPIDMGIMNIYGIRAPLPEGYISIRDVYNILPFENSLCIIALNGKELKELLTDILRAKNMNICGARIEGNQQGELLNAWVDGQKIDDKRIYRIATIDYLAEGNDGLKTLANVQQKSYLEDSRLRDCFITYIRQMQTQKKSLTSTLDRRIIIR